MHLRYHEDTFALYSPVQEQEAPESVAGYGDAGAGAAAAAGDVGALLPDQGVSALLLHAQIGTAWPHVRSCGGPRLLHDSHACHNSLTAVNMIA